MRCSSKAAGDSLQLRIEQALQASQPPSCQQGGAGVSPAAEPAGQIQPGGAPAASVRGEVVVVGHKKPKNKFESKTEQSSSEMYFSYYGMIMHQQNMLQVRDEGGSRTCCR